MTLGALLVVELAAGANISSTSSFFSLLLYCPHCPQANPVSGGGHGGSLHPA